MSSLAEADLGTAAGRLQAFKAVTDEVCAQQMHRSRRRPELPKLSGALSGLLLGQSVPRGWQASGPELSPSQQKNQARQSPAAGVRELHTRPALEAEAIRGGEGQVIG
jgi:hypothetical protein